MATIIRTIKYTLSVVTIHILAEYKIKVEILKLC